MMAPGNVDPCPGVPVFKAGGRESGFRIVLSGGESGCLGYFGES